ncbi:hypothetical protein B0G82_6723 [Paraburkholderia sp. BL17N1]|nr:hypothetical protein B0G82_6723 [Paraburkholderia sp. BL17N1]
MLAKHNWCTSQAPNAAGLVLGARLPIIVTSRADSAHARLASAALAKLAAECASPSSGWLASAVASCSNTPLI